MQQPTRDKPYVLVVDDEVLICDILREFLELEGFTTRVCFGGTEALEILAQEPIDILLTDLKMPDHSGLDLLRRLRELGRDTVALVMTGFGTVETAIDAMKLGAFDYILKPFKPDEVLRIVERAAEHQKLRRENFELRASVGFYELSQALSSAMPLDDQLGFLLQMVRDNLNADAVSITVEDPARPGTFVRRAHMGNDEDGLNLGLVLDALRQGDRVVAHDDAVAPWFSDHAAKATAFMATPLSIRGTAFGVMHASSRTMGQRFTEGHRKGLAIFGSRAANAIETARMYGSLQDTFTQTIEGFARALEAKDGYTHGHSDRVAMYSERIARAMNLPEPVVVRIRHGGLMHDVGKIGIRSGSLNKPQKLTPDEYLMFQSHPVKGRRIIEPISFLMHLVPCVYHHHESWDGTGYPQKLSGRDIPLEARVLAVADSYDAMTSHRPYRKALPHDIALAELRRCAGRQFDPEVVAAFLSAVDALRQERAGLGHEVPR